MLEYCKFLVLCVCGQRGYLDVFHLKTTQFQVSIAAYSYWRGRGFDTPSGIGYPDFRGFQWSA
jgi:hypothetical protein